jgi:hypothetical protein
MVWQWGKILYCVGWKDILIVQSEGTVRDRCVCVCVVCVVCVCGVCGVCVVCVVCVCVVCVCVVCVCVWCVYVWCVCVNSPDFPDISLLSIDSISLSLSLSIPYFVRKPRNQKAT